MLVEVPIDERCGDVLTAAVPLGDIVVRTPRSNGFVTEHGRETVPCDELYVY